MTSRLSYSLCRAIKHLTISHRVVVNHNVISAKFLNKQFSHAGFCSTENKINLTTATKQVQNVELTKREDGKIPSILEEEIDRELVPTEDFPVYTQPTFNFAAYVNESETLQKLVELGVNLSRFEKQKGVPQYILKLDFDRDIKGHLLFLHGLGVPAENFGKFITKNPFIFKNSLEDLETRLYYLRSKNFEFEQVQRIVVEDPFWLNFSTRRIDRRLGWFQKNFVLTGDDVRFLATKFPRLITSHLMHVREMNFCVREELGFDADETKVLLLAFPKLFMKSKLIKLFSRSHRHFNFLFSLAIQTRMQSSDASTTLTKS
jgi:hypothetical protein